MGLMRLRAVVAAGVVVLAGCGGGSGGDTARLSDEVEQAARQAQLEIDAATERFRDCLQAQGFDPLAASPDAGVGLATPDVAEDLDTSDPLAVARRLGLGFAPVALAEIDRDPGEDEEADADPSAADQARQRAEASCRDEAGLDDTPAALARLGELTAQAAVRAQSTAEYAGLVEEWRECMAGAGYEVASPPELTRAAELALAAVAELEELPIEIASARPAGADAESEDAAVATAVALFGGASTLAELADTEVEVAVAAATCRQDTGFDDTLAQLYDRAVADLLEG